jgi:hypothetical protein
MTNRIVDLLFIISMLIANLSSAAERELKVLGGLAPQLKVVASTPQIPNEILIEVLSWGLKEGLCAPPKSPSPRLICTVKISSYTREIELLIRSLPYKLHRRIIPLTDNLAEYDLGEILLEPSLHDLSLVDIVPGPDLSFDFKVRNITDNPVFIKDIRFIFYSGSGVLSVCMPVWHTLYEFPLSAIFGDQQIQVSAGSRLSDDFQLPKEVQDDTLHQLYVADNYTKPHLATAPLKLSQAVPPKGVDSFQIRFVVDKKHVGRPPRECKWHELYEAHAIISYNESNELVTPKFQVGYHPAFLALPVKQPLPEVPPNKGMEPTR